MGERLWGLVAEFVEAGDAVRTARAVKEAGYKRFDAYSPMPMEELSDAVGMDKTRVPAVFLVAGIIGGLMGFGLCWYANVISYPWNIGGRPHNSWPAWIPITFELTVLFAAVSGAVGMFIMNRLPRHHHPLFNVAGFERAQRDRYFVAIEARDARFELGETRKLLEGFGPVRVEEVPMDLPKEEYSE